MSPTQPGLTPLVSLLLVRRRVVEPDGTGTEDGERVLVAFLVATLAQQSTASASMVRNAMKKGLLG